MTESTVSVSFSDLGISPDVLEAIEVLGFTTPSDIQAKAIPAALEGHDIVGLSYTGSGKTLAFGIPALEQVDSDSRDVQVLALCPTRELAMQVCREMDKLCLFMEGVSTVPVYGGASFRPQLDAFRKGVQVVVGTPGRIIDHVESGALKLDKVRMLILDEADEMMDMGFTEDIERIVSHVPEDRQTLLFSATMSSGIKRLVENFTHEAETISIERPVLTVPQIEQVYNEVVFSSRIEVLSRLLETGRMKLGMVFANTKRTVDDIVDGLMARGYAVDRLHGDMPQNMRERVMDSFRRGSLRLLVATDIAARGIDVDNVDTVVNYELPRDPEDYVHRIGRTARAGKSGRAVTFIGRRDFSLLNRIERFIGTKLTREPVMTGKQVAELHQESLVDEIIERVKPDVELPECLKEIEAEKDQLIAALFSLLHEKTSRPIQPIPEDKPTKRQLTKLRHAEEDADMPVRLDEDGFVERSRAGNGDTTSLFMNAGNSLGIKPKDVAGMIYGEVEMPKGAVGDIRIFAKHTIIEVATEFAPAVLEKLATAEVCGYEVNLREDKGVGYRGDSRGVRDRGGFKRGGDRGGFRRGGDRSSRSGDRGDRGERGSRSFEGRGERRGGRGSDRFDREDRFEGRSGRSSRGGRSYERRDGQDRRGRGGRK